jgi:hypothetical protein
MSGVYNFPQAVQDDSLWLRLERGTAWRDFVNWQHCHHEWIENPQDRAGTTGQQQQKDNSAHVEQGNHNKTTKRGQLSWDRQRTAMRGQLLEDSMRREPEEDSQDEQPWQKSQGRKSVTDGQ